MLQYWNWCHAIGIHMYFIPSLIVLAVLLIGAGIHWRNQNKRKKEGEEAAAKAAGAAVGANTVSAERG